MTLGNPRHFLLDALIFSIICNTERRCVLYDTFGALPVSLPTRLAGPSNPPFRSIVPFCILMLYQLLKLTFKFLLNMNYEYPLFRAHRHSQRASDGEQIYSSVTIFEIKTSLSLFPIHTPTYTSWPTFHLTRRCTLRISIAASMSLVGAFLHDLNH